MQGMGAERGRGGASSGARERVAAALLLVLSVAVVALSVDRVRLEQHAAEACPACVPRTVVQRPFRPVEFTTDLGQGVLYTGHSGNFIDFHILVYGAYEKPLLHFLRNTLRALVPSGGVFVDIGANTGQHSLFLSPYAEQVHAFEPYPPVLARFRSMVEANHIDNVAIHPVGLGREAARLPFHEPDPTNLGTGSFVDGFRSEDAAVQTLEIVVGDEALAAADVERVDLIKLDVEGYEKPVLEGLRATLAGSRPVVAMELTIDPASDDLFASEEELAAAFPPGYACRAFHYGAADLWSGGYRLGPCVLDFAHKGQRGLVWIPEESVARVPASAASLASR
jgi:FkbM family methyltransferase